MDLKQFLDLIFDTEDSTCFTATTTGYKVQRACADSVKPEHQFLCINALDAERDAAPIKPWHAENKPRRADVNVTKHRTFLIESDSLPVDRQVRYFDRLGLPYTAATFSGSKSVHFLITLTEPVDKETYRTLAKRLQASVNFADSSSQNASRLSRLPGNVRLDTGLTQSLLKLNRRIELAELMEFVNTHSTPAAAPDYSQTSTGVNPKNRRRVKFLSAANRAFLEKGDLGSHTSRHAALMSLAGGLAFLEFEPEVIEEKLAEAADRCGLSAEPGRDVDEEIRNIVLWVTRR